MLDSGLSKEEADAIYKLPKSIMSESNVISWGNATGASRKIIIDVITEDGLELEIQGWYRWKGSKRYGFTLLYRKTVSIRRWDDKKGHRDPCSKTVLMGPHKHYYHPDFGDSCAKDTNDIRSGDVNGAFFDFLKECNISMGDISYQAFVA